MIFLAGFAGSDPSSSMVARQLLAAAIPRPVDFRLQNVRRFSPGKVRSLPRHAI